MNAKNCCGYSNTAAFGVMCVFGAAFGYVLCIAYLKRCHMKYESSNSSPI